MKPAVGVGIVVVLTVVDVVALGDALAAQFTWQVVGTEPFFVEVCIKVVKHVEEQPARVAKLVLLLLFLCLHLRCIVSLKLINPLVDRLVVISDLLFAFFLSFLRPICRHSRDFAHS